MAAFVWMNCNLCSPVIACQAYFLFIERERERERERDKNTAFSVKVLKVNVISIFSLVLVASVGLSKFHSNDKVTFHYS